MKDKIHFLRKSYLSLFQVPEDQGEVDDSSEKSPSKTSKSPQKSTKRPKTVPVKVTLLDGSDYETAVEVYLSLLCVFKMKTMFVFPTSKQKGLDILAKLNLFTIGT